MSKAENTNTKAKQSAPIAEQEKQTSKRDTLFLVLNLIQVAFFIAFTIKGFLDDFGESPYVPFIIALIVAYVVAFVAAIVMSFGRKDVKRESKQLKQRVKDTKLALKVITVIMLCLNVLAALLVLLDTYTSDAGLFKQIFALASAGFAAINAGLQLIKVGRKVRKRVKKEKKAKKKAEKSAK